jgi:hypothetical protein
MLLELGGDVDALDTHGKNAYHYSKCHSCEDSDEQQQNDFQELLIREGSERM